jgi:hypothetical protein
MWSARMCSALGVNDEKIPILAGTLAALSGGGSDCVDEPGINRGDTG